MAAVVVVAEGAVGDGGSFLRDGGLRAQKGISRKFRACGCCGALIGSVDRMVRAVGYGS